MAAETDMTTGGLGNVRRLSQRTSATGKSIEYTTPPKRATTVHITSPASRNRRMNRPISNNDLLEKDPYILEETASPPSHQRKLRLSNQPLAAHRTSNNKPAVLDTPITSVDSVTVDRGDPFVTYNSDSSFSVESSLADDHSIRSLPAPRPGSFAVPITPSAAALQNPAAAAAALAAANARSRDPQGNRRVTALSTPRRTRPASVAVMTSTSTTITEDANSRPRTPERLEQMLEQIQTPITASRRPREVSSPTMTTAEEATSTPTSLVRRLSRHVSSPAITTAEDVTGTPTFLARRLSRHVSSPAITTAEDVTGTPTSLARRLSRRLSATSRDFLVSNTSPNRSEPNLPSFPEIPDLPPILPPSFPNAEQLASLDRRNSVNVTLTPPRMRGRSNTAPKAAAGARRYVLFPDLMEGEVNDLLEEEDITVEEPATTPVETPIEETLPAPTPFEEVVVAETKTTAVVPPTPMKRKEKLQARISGARSLLSSAGWNVGKASTAGQGEGEGTKCVVM